MQLYGLGDENREQPFEEGHGAAGGSGYGHDPATQNRNLNVSWPAAKAAWTARRGFCSFALLW